MAEIVGDHAKADPSLHSTVAPVEAAPETMAPFENTDTALAAGPPLLPLLKPTLLLFALAIGALG